MRNFVIGTVREKACDRNSALMSLVLDRPYEGFSIQPIQNLHALSQSNLLWVRVGEGYFAREVRVKIYWSPTHLRWIAETVGDNSLYNNLDFLPVYQAGRSDGQTTYFDQCPL